MSKQPSKPRPALDAPTIVVFAPLPEAWKVGNCRYELIARGDAWCLKTWRGGQFTGGEWYFDEDSVRTAIQETHR